MTQQGTKVVDNDFSKIATVEDVLGISPDQLSPAKEPVSIDDILWGNATDATEEQPAQQVSEETTATPAEDTPPPKEESTVETATSTTEDELPPEVKEIMDGLFSDNAAVQEATEELGKATDDIKDKIENTNDPELKKKYEDVLVELEAAKTAGEQWQIKANALEKQYTELRTDKLVKDSEMADMKRMMDVIDTNPLVKSLVTYSYKAAEDPEYQTKAAEALKPLVKQMLGIDLDELLSKSKVADAAMMSGDKPVSMYWGAQSDGKPSLTPGSIEEVLGGFGRS